MWRHTLSLLQCLLLSVAAQAITIPRDHVFVFERNTNTNYVCYDINLQDGKLNSKDPLKIYWVLGGETRIEGLTYLDRKMAYGIKVVEEKEDEATIHMTAYKNLNIRICGRADHVLSQIILDSTEAADQIPDYAQGRFITQDGTGFQAYWFDDEGGF